MSSEYVLIAHYGVYGDRREGVINKYTRYGSNLLGKYHGLAMIQWINLITMFLTFTLLMTRIKYKQN